MKPVYIHKDNFDENPFVTMFLTDNSPFVLAGIGIALGFVILFLVILRSYNFPLLILLIACSEYALFVLTKGKKQSEPRYKVLRRQLGFIFAKKHHSARDLTRDLSDVKIVGDYLQRKKTLIAMFELTPRDISLIGENALDEYYTMVKQTYHSLPTQIQLITKKRIATEKDYYPHIFSLYAASDPKREGLIRQYAQELSEFVSSHTLYIPKHYLVFSAPLTGAKEKEYVQAMKTLYDYEQRISDSFSSCRILMKQLTHEELLSYCKQSVS